LGICPHPSYLCRGVGCRVKNGSCSFFVQSEMNAQPAYYHKCFTISGYLPLMLRWTGCKRYCHLLTTMKSYVASTKFVVGPHSERVFAFSAFCLWPPCVSTADITFCHDVVSFIFCLLSSFFPRVFSAVADWMSTILPRMVWP